MALDPQRAAIAAAIPVIIGVASTFRDNALIG